MHFLLLSVVPRVGSEGKSLQWEIKNKIIGFKPFLLYPKLKMKNGGFKYTVIKIIHKNNSGIRLRSTSKATSSFTVF